MSTKPAVRRCKTFVNYKATSDGQLIDLDGNKVSQYLSCKGRYYQARVKISGRFYMRYVHVMIADAFLGPRKQGMQVRHLDGNSLNNNSKNLAYGTIFQNADDRRLHGRYPSGQDHPNAVLTNQKVIEIISLRKEKVKVRVIAEMMGVSIPCIEQIIYNKTYLNVPR